jgi:hypothetical protein
MWKLVQRFMSGWVQRNTACRLLLASAEPLELAANGIVQRELYESNERPGWMPRECRSSLLQRVWNPGTKAF